MPNAPKAPKTLDELAVLADLTLADIQRFTKQDFETLLLEELEVKNVKVRAKLQRQHRELLDGPKVKTEQAATLDNAAGETTAGVDMGVKDQEADAGEAIPAMALCVDASNPTQTDSGDQASLPNSVAETQPLTVDESTADGTTIEPATTDAAGTAEEAATTELAQLGKCATVLSSLRTAPWKACDKYVERGKVWKQAKKDQMRMCGASFCHFCCWPETQEQRQAWIAAQARLQELESEAALTKWKVGDTVDVDTEDGTEKGAVIIGPAQGGDETQMRVRFADGTVDDWDTEDFIRASTTSITSRWCC
jgi:hypothetical protein